MESEIVVQAAQPALREQFALFRQTLDDHANRRERIIRASRDMTAQSKKVIFLLQRAVQSDDRAPVIQEASKQLAAIRELLRPVVDDLAGPLFHRFHRNITDGLQEYIEAATFLQYVEDASILPKDRLDADFAPFGLAPTDEDYALGVADMTGELMRLCVTSAATGNSANVSGMLAFCRGLADELNQLPLPSLGKKTATLAASLQKIEKVCYSVQLRGAEYPKEMIQSMLEMAERESRPDADDGERGGQNKRPRTD